MGNEAYDDDRGHDHDKDCRDDGDHDHHQKYCKCKKERDEYKRERDEYRKERDEYKKERDEWKHAAWKYKKERDEYKGFLKDALERLGVAVHKLGHLLDNIVDASTKIGKDHDDHDKGHDKDHG
jgi:uncharacterized coiled-coil DUF342 family protein